MIWYKITIHFQTVSNNSFKQFLLYVLLKNNKCYNIHLPKTI